MQKARECGPFAGALRCYAWAARSFVDNWADLPMGRGRPQNWGLNGIPKLPQAMDSSVRW